MWVVGGDMRSPEKLPEEKQVGVVTDLHYPPCLEGQFWAMLTFYAEKHSETLKVGGNQVW